MWMRAIIPNALSPTTAAPHRCGPGALPTGLRPPLLLAPAMAPPQLLSAGLRHLPPSSSARDGLHGTNREFAIFLHKILQFKKNEDGSSRRLFLAVFWRHHLQPAPQRPGRSTSPPRGVHLCPCERASHLCAPLGGTMRLATQHIYAPSSNLSVAPCNCIVSRSNR